MLPSWVVCASSVVAPHPGYITVLQALTQGISNQTWLIHPSQKVVRTIAKSGIFYSFLSWGKTAICLFVTMQWIGWQKIRKTSGEDDMPAPPPSPHFFLRVCSDQLAPIFTQISNKALEFCRVSSRFKRSILTATPKKKKCPHLPGPRLDFQNTVIKKAQQRMYCWVSKESSTVSQLCTSITIWFGSETKLDENRQKCLLPTCPPFKI